MPETAKDINLEHKLQDKIHVQNCCNIYTSVYENLHLNKKVQNVNEAEKEVFLKKI